MTDLSAPPPRSPSPVPPSPLATQEAFPQTLAPLQGGMPIFFASHDGHTRKIALFLADRLDERGIETNVRDLETDFPTPAEMAVPGPIVLLAAIRYGFHLPAARRFLRAFHARLEKGPLTIVSINLTARKPAKRTKETNVYLRKLLARAHLDPALALALAGELNYPRYDWIDRVMIQLIMHITGGPTDPSLRIDYTPWEEVDRLASQIADLQITSSSAH